VLAAYRWRDRSMGPGGHHGFLTLDPFLERFPNFLNSTMNTPPRQPNHRKFCGVVRRESLAQGNAIGEVIPPKSYASMINFVVVNAGLKSESYIPAEEFRNDRGEVEAQPGDFISARSSPWKDGYGETRLSRDKAEAPAAWHELEEALEKGTVVQARSTARSRAASPSW